MNAKLRIDFAGPFISVQDRGRAGFLRFGVTESGPMDRSAFEILRHALGGGDDFCAIEVSVGGLSVTCTQGPVTVGVIGGAFDIRLDGVAQPGWSVFTMAEGQTLTLRPGPWGSWCYLGFVGQINSPEWLGSHAAHLASGLCGRALQAGDEVSISGTDLRRDLNAAFPIPDAARFDGRLRIVLGPQDHHFDAAALRALATEEFRLSQEYDRMGVRLKGPCLMPQNALSIPSEALVRGSVQVPGHGDPLILLADHQTTGGYPKIATVITADLDLFAQARPGDKLRFKLVDVAEAITATRAAHKVRQAYLDRLPDFRGSLSERLFRMNLISGAVADTPDG